MLWQSARPVSCNNAELTPSFRIVVDAEHGALFKAINGINFFDDHVVEEICDHRKKEAGLDEDELLRETLL